MRIEKSKIRCDICRGRGKLWLHGADYVECPQCNTTGEIDVITHRVQARRQTVFMAGMRPFTVTVQPQRAMLTDTVIQRVD